MVNKGRDPSQVVFLTAGTIVRRFLEQSPGGALSGCTHLIIDEAHERSVDIDLILLALRDALLRPTNAASLHCLPKIILMSATLDPTALSGYFTGSMVGYISVPGRVYPVSVHYLEDAVLRTGYSCREGDLNFGREKQLPVTPTLTPRASAQATAREATAAVARNVQKNRAQ